MAAHHSTGIYEIRNVINGKRYVGSAVNFGNRFRQHAQSLDRGDHHCIALQRAWRMYGACAFQFNRLLVCDKENLIMYEQAVMDGLHPEYNSAPKAGSNLGLRMSDESKAKLSAAAKRTKNFTGKTHSESSRAKISAAKKGVPTVPCSPEKKAKLSAIHKGRIIPAEQRAKISATLTGHKQSAEQIAKRVEKLKGRKMPPGFAEAASARMIGKKASPETLEKMSRARASLSEQQVQQVRALLAEKKTHRLIAVIFGVSHSTIADIACGRKYRWVK